ncbi:MAG: T9SS type A sorting domain-containing protein, partial [Bacteroidetes bacterium]|nr:T9SS type A sorting domain-containing protein [Bacteroidota bacterium]
LRGGDQAQYVALWKGTLTEQALREVFQRGGVLGGTSAGEMVLSDVSFTSGTTSPWTILRTPTTSMTLVDDFLPLATNTLAESHTNERGRIGRLPVFLARYKNTTGRSVTGLGVDVNTAIVIDSNGVGEVMGGSAVAVLRWDAETAYSIEAGKPFALQNMRYDNLLPGWKMNLGTGEITPPPSAVAFTASSLSMPAGPVILDGSGNAADWTATAGSLRRLQTLLSGATDSVGIVASPATPSSATTVQTTLAGWGIASRIIWIDEGRKNDAATAAMVTASAAIIFAGNSIDSLSRFFSSTTVGAAFQSRVSSGMSTLFLGEDVMLAGEQAVSGLYSNSYSAYYGLLTQVPGLGLLKGMQLAPRFYQNTNNTVGYDQSENRSMGMLWSMGQSRLPYGFLIDAGAHVVFSNDSISVFGVLSNSTPVIQIDARNAVWTDFPTFKRPGRPNAVKNAALVGARLHVLRTGETTPLTSIGTDESIIPERAVLEQNYPNPFNPETNFGFRIAEFGFIDLAVHDILGREVAILANGLRAPGSYTVTWDASEFPSGIYFCRMVFNGTTQIRKMILMK